MRSPRSIFAALAVTSIAVLASGCLILDGSFHEREMTSFKFTTASNPSLRMDRIGDIGTDSRKIVVSLPDYLDRHSLATDFSFRGAKVLVSGREQESGITKNDFTSPITYSVLGIDDETTDYVIEVVVVPASSAKDLMVLGIGAVQRYNEGTSLRYPFATSLVYEYPWYSGVDLSRLYFAFSTTATRVVSGGTTLVPTDGLYPITPYSASNILDFTKPITFTVTAEDYSTADYVANLTIGAQ